MKYYKKSTKQASLDKNTDAAYVAKMIETIRENKEEAIKNYVEKFDKWQGDIIVSNDDIKKAAGKITAKIKQDIHFCHDQVQKFAIEQRKSLKECTVTLIEGLVAGQKLIPIQNAGCYVPGGRYAHISSAIMSVATAKVAGVKNIIACSPAKNDFGGIHPAILYALSISGADVIMNLGGVPAIASMAMGCFDQKPVDIIVGPGNQYVAQAKKLLYGEVGIDIFAGPTEIAIIADETADADIVAYDLVGQAEHGYNSPAWLITLDQKLAEITDAKVRKIIEDLPQPNKDNAFAAWQDYGEIILVSSREEAVTVSDEYAAEHLEIHADDLDWWFENLTNYGSLFLGEQTTVAYGDKISGPNHILPTLKAARYTGGLYVGKFLKTVTWQKMTREANRKIAPICSRICRTEGMEAHARSSDIRLQKYFPKEQFDTGKL